MPASGIILRDANRAVISGTATGGSTTTLVDAAGNFIVNGVMVGDTIVVWDGAGLNQRAVITVVAATTLTFAALPVSLAAGSVYQIIRGTFVIIKGSVRVKHRPRVPVLDVPSKQGDTVQGLGRKSRAVRSESDAQLYRGDVATSGRDAAHVSDAQQLRTWCDAVTTVFLDTLTEATLPVRFTEFDVFERAGSKGFPITFELVEVA